MYGQLIALWRAPIVLSESIELQSYKCSFIDCFALFLGAKIDILNIG